MPRTGPASRSRSDIYVLGMAGYDKTVLKLGSLSDETREKKCVLPWHRTRNKACSPNFDIVGRTVRRVPRQSISVVLAAVPLDVRKGSAFPSPSQLRIQEAKP